MYLTVRDNAGGKFTQEQNEENDRWLREWLNVCIAMMVLTNVFVILRIIARRLPKQSAWGFDDLFVGLGWASNMISLSLNFYTIHSNFQSVDPNASPMAAFGALSNTLRGIYGVEMVYITSYTFPKLSILFLYLRIFPSRGMRKFLWCLVAFLVADAIAFIFPAILICNPPRAFWNFTVHGKCIDNDAYNRATPAPNILTDIIMLILPLPTVMKLKASLAKRLAIAFTFMTGSAGLVVAVVRWAYFLKYSVHNSSISVTSKLDILAIVETSTYLMAACMPPLRGLFQYWFKTGPLGTSLSQIFVRSQTGSATSEGRLRSKESGALGSSDGPTGDRSFGLSSVEADGDEMIGHNEKRLEPVVSSAHDV